MDVDGGESGSASAASSSAPGSSGPSSSFQPGDGFKAGAPQRLGGVEYFSADSGEMSSVIDTPSVIRAEEAQELKQWEEAQLKAAAEADALRVCCSAPPLWSFITTTPAQHTQCDAHTNRTTTAMLNRRRALQEKELAELLEKQAASDLYTSAMNAINKTIDIAQTCVNTCPTDGR